MRIGEVEIISMLMPSAASASNRSAATPGWAFMPAPTSDTFAIWSSIENRVASTSFTTRSMTDLQARDVRRAAR